MPSAIQATASRLPSPAATLTSVTVPPVKLRRPGPASRRRRCARPTPAATPSPSRGSRPLRCRRGRGRRCRPRSRRRGPVDRRGRKPACVRGGGGQKAGGEQDDQDGVAKRLQVEGHRSRPTGDAPRFRRTLRPGRMPSGTASSPERRRLARDARLVPPQLGAHHGRDALHGVEREHTVTSRLRRSAAPSPQTRSRRWL